MRWWMTSFVLPFVLAATLQPAPTAKAPELRFRLECLAPGELLATIRNEGSADTAVIVGVVLGNGAKYMVGDLRLFIKTGGEPEYVRVYRPRDYPAHIGGSLEDWIVPLPVNASFGLRLRVSDFEGWRSRTTFPASTLSVRLVIRGPSLSASPDVRLFRVWTEKDAIRSNQVHVPDDCR